MPAPCSNGVGHQPGGRPSSAARPDAVLPLEIPTGPAKMEHHPFTYLLTWPGATRATAVDRLYPRRPHRRTGAIVPVVGIEADTRFRVVVAISESFSSTDRISGYPLVSNSLTHRRLRHAQLLARTGEAAHSARTRHGGFLIWCKRAMLAAQYASASRRARTAWSNG
jgi:hypothetical protein